MKIKTSLLISCAIWISAAAQLHAAATEDEAKRLTKVFQSYLSDTQGVVSVALDGDGYSVKLDFGPLADIAAAMSKDKTGVIKMSPVEFKIASQGDGKWQVVENQPFTFDLDMGEQGAIHGKEDVSKFSGVYDEKLGNFANFTREVENFTLSERIKDPNGIESLVEASFKNMKVEQTATASAGGGADLDIKYTVDAFSENINASGKTEAGVPPMNFLLTSTGGAFSVTGKNTKAKPFLDIFAFFVAHKSKELIANDQAMLKSVLTASLPLFDNMQGTGQMNGFKVATQFGEFGADTFDFAVDMNGVVKDGKFREKIGLKGINVPAALVPPWAVNLVPKNMTFDFTLSGFDLASPADAILKQIDFTKTPPLPDGFEAVLLPSLMPKGTVDIGLGPTEISNDTYNLKLEGTMSAGPAAIPTGKATITAKGLDEIMKVVQAAPPEAGLGSGMAVIIAAKGIAKAGPDGALTWDVESAPGGKVLVNGIDPTTLK